MTERPRLRPVEAFPVQHNGETLIYLKDPLNLAPPLGVSPVGYFILSHFDGRHSLIDIQEQYCRRFGDLLLTEQLKGFIDMLDRHYYLVSERFLEHQARTVEEFRRRPTRAAAHAGGVYKTDPAELAAQLDGYFTHPKGPGMPGPGRRSAPPRAIVAPHIDFHRGGPAYAWAYKELAESEGADLYILLGTSHCGGEHPFILTFKDFETPLGPVETDKEFAGKLVERCGSELLADEYLHRGEHSIEFQAVFLQYVARGREALGGRRPRPFKIVPILVSSFHAMIHARTAPEEQAPVASFLSALRELTAADSRRVCFVAGVDLAHVGRQFGDREEMTPEFLRWVEEEDRRLIDRLAALDARGFFDEVAKDQDRRRICGFAPLYSLIRLLEGARGRNLTYDQAFTPETASAVTFTAMVFE
ncbi:MAG TPA: AmmeMemoRadiSam system protein B [candidate division Zixibacteria bacterium]|nr:AmmeMemoRadiSam system protein B [candidate division Zixibacteria bacterium]